MLRLIRRDGREEEVSSYRIEGDQVHIARGGLAPLSLGLDEIDLERTFRASAGVEFGAAKAAAEPGAAVLELVARSQRNEGDYLVVEGLVRNLSAEEQTNLVAKVLGEDGEGRFVTSEEVLVDYSPLGASASPFRVVLKSGGRVAKARLQFRLLSADRHAGDVTRNPKRGLAGSAHASIRLLGRTPGEPAQPRRPWPH